MYAYRVAGKNVILHIFMYNVMSDFSGARELVKEGLRKMMLFVILNLIRLYK